ncbi:MAG: TolC family protein [Candidatus Omnitrophica bacterium]|nr:TolC family protein [Candidatus Omnitrophota bacterium]
MVKRKLISFLIVVFISYSSSYAEISENNKSGLSIETAIQIAIQSNKSIQMQKTEIQKSYADKLYAISNFLPKADLNYKFDYYDAVLSSTDTGTSRKDSRIFQGYESDNTLSITVAQDLFKGGAHIANFKEADLKFQSQKETCRATVLEVEFDTQRLFYGLLLAYETRRIARDLVGQAEAHYEEVLAKYKQGTASRFDVLQSKVQVSRLMPELIDAENSIRIIKEEFKKLLGVDMREDVNIKGELYHKQIEIKEEMFLTEAYERRPEMKLKSLGVDIEKWGIEFAKSSGIPQATGNFEYYARSNNVADMVNERHDNWSIGFKVKIPIFDGLSTPARIDVARARYAYAKLDKEDYVDQIAVDVRKACIDLEDSQSIIIAQKDSIVEAKEALRLSEVRYNTGVGINLDVLDAQVALAQIEQSLAEARYDYIMAKANLDRVMGREFFKEE